MTPDLSFRSAPFFQKLTWIERFAYRFLNWTGFRSEFVSLDEAQLHFVRGRGDPNLPTIVLLHGIGANVTHWTEVLFHLRWAGYPTLALDLPAHGISSEYTQTLSPSHLSSALRRFLEAQVSGPFVLIGNSLGGGLVLREVEGQNTQLRAFVALSPAGGFKDETAWNSLQQSIRIRSKEDALGFMRKVFHRLPFFAGLFVRPLIAAMNRKGVRELIENTQFSDFLLERSPASTPPGLIVWGQSDHVFPQENLQWFKTTFSSLSTKFSQPEKTGHCPQVERGYWTAKQILRFLKESL